MFYYKNIGENEVPECNRGGNSLKQNPRISSVPRRTSSSVSFHVWTVPGACPTKHRQWADFLVPLVAPLHRQYKTARTELVIICYWKQGRWQLRQRLRAVMFCSVVPRRGTHKSPKIVCGLRTPPVECSKLGKTQMIKDVRRGMVRNTGFCD